MRARTLISRGLLAAAAACIAGCSPPRETSDKIVVWHQKTGAERVFFERAVEAYNRNNPGEQIKALYREGEELRNSFVIAAVAGQGPDLVFGPADNVAVFAQTKTIRPWDEVLGREFLGLFTEEGVVRWGGHPWLVSDQIGNQLMLVCDRRAVERAPGTLDELVAMGRDLTVRTDGKTERYALTWNYAEPYFFVPFLTGFGGWIMDEKGRPTLDTPEMRAALQFVLDLRDKHGVIPRYEDYATANLMFQRGRAAMIINGPWAWADYGVPESSFLALLPVNTATGLRCRPIIAAKGYSLNVNTPPSRFTHVRRAMEYLTGDELQLGMAQSLLTIPTRKTALDDPAFRANPVLQVAMQQAEYSVPIPIMPQLRCIWDAMRDPYRRVFTRELSPEKAARKMQKEAERLIAEVLP
ncbi:MAG: extracellular solute-binding protein [Chthoniobacterales bacterium]|nr:extracellular solute-binding protein [Chthoniobacterales bacterium]